MGDVEPDSIENVFVEPDNCHRCGGEIGTCEFEGREHAWCGDCELVLSRTPIPVVQVVVHDENSLLLLDEPISWQEGFWSLPGGHVQHDEEPKVSVLRELEEETNLEANPEDLEFLTIYHNEVPGKAFYLITYELERQRTSGEVRPEGEGFEAEFVPVEGVTNSANRLRDSDWERVDMVFDE